MSNNIIENFEKASGRSYDSFYSEAKDMLNVNFDPSLSYEDNYENGSQLVQGFVDALLGKDYPLFNEISSYTVDKFYSEEK